MAVSWTHTVEERLSRLERRQERLMAKLAALADALHQRLAPGSAGLTGDPAANPGPTPGASLPVRSPATPGPRARSGTSASATQARTEAAEAPAEGQEGQAPATMGGGQAGSLAMWRPPQGVTVRDRRQLVLRRVDELSETVHNLMAAMQRMQVMCDLLGHCVYLAVDPQAAEQRLSSLGIPLGGGPGPDAGGSRGAGGESSAGPANTLAGLLPALLARAGGTNEGEGGSGSEGDAGAGGSAGGDGEGAGGSGDADGAGTQEASALEAGAASVLLPLVQAVMARTGGDEAAARLGAVMGSPAFQKLVGMLQTEGGVH